MEFNIDFVSCTKWWTENKEKKEKYDKLCSELQELEIKFTREPNIFKSEDIKVNIDSMDQLSSLFLNCRGSKGFIFDDTNSILVYDDDYESSDDGNDYRR